MSTTAKPQCVVYDDSFLDRLLSEMCLFESRWRLTTTAGRVYDDVTIDAIKAGWVEFIHADKRRAVLRMDTLACYESVGADEESAWSVVGHG